MTNRKKFLGLLLAGVAAGVLAPRTLGAVNLRLDDNRSLPNGQEDPVVYAVDFPSPYGFDPTSIAEMSGVSFPEQFDLHGEYVSVTPLAPGVVKSVNINLYDDANFTFVGDTLNMVFTGHSPTANDPNNISVDMHFRSDANEQSLTALTDGGYLANYLEVPGFMVFDSDVIAGGGPSDFHISVVSLPEPGSVLMMASGAVMLLRRRRP